jgi:hypothetical protein
MGEGMGFRQYCRDTDPRVLPELPPHCPCTAPCRKRKLEELVTKHLGKSRDVSDEDIKSSVLYGGWVLLGAAERRLQAGSPPTTPVVAAP